jgi:hypothetical protein
MFDFFYQRLQQFNEILNYNKSTDKVINISRLRQLCFDIGCPDDQKHIRSLIWKVSTH